MADQLPPDLLAMMDQGLVAVSASLDESIGTVRLWLKTQSRELALANAAGQFVLYGMPTSMATMLALAVLRLAEAEEARGG